MLPEKYRVCKREHFCHKKYLELIIYKHVKPNSAKIYLGFDLGQDNEIKLFLENYYNPMIKRDLIYEIHEIFTNKKLSKEEKETKINLLIMEN